MPIRNWSKLHYVLQRHISSAEYFFTWYILYKLKNLDSILKLVGHPVHNTWDQYICIYTRKWKLWALLNKYQRLYIFVKLHQIIT